MESNKSTLNIITPVSADLANLLPHPDHTLPGRGSAGGEHPSHPIYYPDVEPSPPIVLPPEGGEQPVDPAYGIDEGAHPDQTLPGDQPHPDHTLPGDQPHPDNTLPIPPEVVEAPDRFEMKVGWTEETGWIVVFVPTGEHATPSKRRG